MDLICSFAIEYLTYLKRFMNGNISVVIVCKNEEHIIGKTLQSVQSFAAEVLVYDTGSTDNTISIAEGAGATVIRAPWEGYGPSKQKAIGLATHDWIMNLDSDEVVDAEAQANIQQLSLTNDRICYRFRFQNFLGNKALKWGEFGFDSHVRLFNRKQVTWNNAPVHEQLQRASGVKEESVKGFILHYTMKDTAEFVQKSVAYALANAGSYFQRGKKATWVKQYLSPLVTFFKYYVVRLGFLDGWAGLFSARMASLYTYVKYARLRELEEREALKDSR
jgi:glycosyltransferase involved in cell wall biosynthesis